MRQTATPDLIRALLAYISANCTRDVWAKVLAAVKSEFNNSVGFQLVDEWSQTAGEHYNAKAVRDTWKSIKAVGGVTLGTLIFMAKQNGFVMPASNQVASPPNAEAAARLASERAAKQAQEKADQQAAHERVAGEADLLFQSAPIDGVSHYLTRKNVQPYGVRFAADGCVLVPGVDAEGKLWNVQRIFPSKPKNGGTDKLFLKNGRKSGLWHWCGNPTGESALLIAEGYATAASIHQATGRPVAVAFDAGNLLPVAKALRQKYPDALITICGDDDVQTFAEKGINPGRTKAEAAARAVGGLCVFPEDLPPGGSDFNDQATAVGVETVRLVIDHAIDTHEPPETAAQAAQTARRGDHAKAKQNVVSAPDPAPAGQSAADGAFDRFHVNDDGLFYTPPGDDGGTPRKVCGPLRVTGMARDLQDNQAGLLLEFDTAFRKSRAWLMPLTMLAGDGSAYRAALLSQGFMTPTDSKRRAWLTEYLQSRKPTEFVRHVPRVGWHGKCYVLPIETLGMALDGERVIFHSEAGVEANFSQRGTLVQWQQDLGRLCVGNSRAAFTVACALAGPLLAWAPGTTGGGFHSVGSTSIGKTTVFLLGASIWGKAAEKAADSFIQKWRATGNGLEAQAEQHNDCTLFLDEIGAMDASDLGASIYMLSDGQGKTRSRGAGGLRPKASWRMLFMSSGELSPTQHMQTAGKTMKGGQEVRLIPIPSEVAPNSALETFHEFEGGHEFSTWVQQHAARCYGTPGRAWLEHLVQNTDGLSARLQERIDMIEAQLLPSGAAGQVKRGARRFALVAVAGEMATEAGLTAWPPGESTRAAKICFDAWINSRGGSGSSEVTSMLKQVRQFLELHAEGRFTWWHRAADDHSAKTLNRAGVRRMLDELGEPVKTDSGHNAAFGDRMHPATGEMISVEFFILPETFKSEICKGFDHIAVCKLLKDRGILICKEPGRYDTKTRLPGIGPTRCYHLSPAIFECAE